MSRLAKTQLKGWRARETVTVGMVERRNSQLGQLLYYLVTLQLRRIQLYLTPTERHNSYGAPHAVLGVFMEESKVCLGLYPLNIAFWEHCLTLGAHAQRGLL